MQAAIGFWGRRVVTAIAALAIAAVFDLTDRAAPAPARAVATIPQPPACASTPPAAERDRGSCWITPRED